MSSNPTLFAILSPLIIGLGTLYSKKDSSSTFCSDLNSDVHARLPPHSLKSDHVHLHHPYVVVEPGTGINRARANGDSQRIVPSLSSIGLSVVQSLQMSERSACLMIRAGISQLFSLAECTTPQLEMLDKHAHEQA
ncbi:unnamed protein product [Periconia digitata]|uniref:Uncharacterized protein n=1 Tax=Periconia digitata TaxID=1303443 RepID=A0A9W4U987_9PLEO|nr:unnamed protein product [Periconia digitata]